MRREKKTPGSIPYVKGTLSGMIAAVLVLYILNISGIIVFYPVKGLSLVALFQWCYKNLGASVIPFSLVAAGYLFYLKKLENLLAAETFSTKEIWAVEDKIDLLMNVFFGIGVIWTAIGMRNALLASLGHVDVEIAAQKGAFYILTQLVEGGILLSLSTTIVGGIGGYLMRIFKAWSIGLKLNAFFDTQLAGQNQAVLERLDRIALLVQENGRGEAL